MIQRLLHISKGVYSSLKGKMVVQMIINSRLESINSDVKITVHCNWDKEIESINSVDD